MSCQMLEVVRENGTTSILCRACVVECESVGKTTVEAMVGLPCSAYLIDQTADEEERRNART